MAGGEDVRESEFGGVPGLMVPAEKGGKRKAYEELGLMHRTDPADETSGTDIVSSREA